MKRLRKFSAIAMTVSSLLVGSNAMAASGEDGTYKNLTLEERLYLFDGYGSKWGFDVGNDGLWMVPERPIGDTYEAPFKIRNGAAENTLVVGINDDMNVTNGYVGIGTDTPTATLDVNGSVKVKSMKTTFDGTSTLNVTELVALSVNNTNGDKMSDTGFKLTNAKEGVDWTFRTLETDARIPGSRNAFAISKKASGAKELIITSNDDAQGGMKMVLANGAYCDGVWHDASSRSLKNDIKRLDTKRAMEAFSKLEPVTFVYKAVPNDPHVGFIAEDVPDLVADPERKSISTVDIVAVLTKVVQEQEKVLKKQSEKIAELEAQQKELAAVKARLSALETVLTNIAYKEDPRTKEGLATEKSVSLIQK